MFCPPEKPVWKNETIDQWCACEDKFIFCECEKKNSTKKMKKTT